MTAYEMDPRRLHRYDKREDRYIIDIALDVYRDVYDDWDFAPFRHRDVDRDLMGHLEDCSREIPLTSGVAIVFHLPTGVKDLEKEERSVAGLRNHFRYETGKAMARRRRYLRRFAVYLVSGVGFLCGAYLVQAVLSGPPPLSVVPDGLFIGGWVLFWEAFSIAFFRNRDVTGRIRHLRRLVDARIAYVYGDRTDDAGAL